MRYTISIDQTHSIEWNLSLSEAALFSFIYSLPSWAEQIHVNGQTWFFASRNKAIDEMPIITDKADTIYRLYKSLQSKGIIDWQKFGEKDCILITEKGKNWNSSKTELGNKSESTRKKIRLKSEINPTYNTIKNNSTIDNSIDINTNVFMPEEEKNEFSHFTKVTSESSDKKVNYFSKVSHKEKEKNCPKKEKETQPEPKPPSDIYLAYEMFCTFHESVSASKYPRYFNGNLILNQIDARNIKLLLDWVAKIDPDNKMDNFKVFIQAAWMLDDKYLQTNFSIGLLYRQCSQIYAKVQNTNPILSKQRKEEQRNAEAAEFLRERYGIVN